MDRQSNGGGAFRGARFGGCWLTGAARQQQPRSPQPLCCLSLRSIRDTGLRARRKKGNFQIKKIPFLRRRRRTEAPPPAAPSTRGLSFPARRRIGGAAFGAKWAAVRRDCPTGGKAATILRQPPNNCKKKADQCRRGLARACATIASPKQPFFCRQFQCVRNRLPKETWLVRWACD